MGIRQKLMMLSVLAGIIVLLISVLGYLQAYHGLKADLRIAYVLLTMFGLFVVALLFFLCTRFAEDITKSVTAIERHAHEIAKGNLALEDLEVTSQDEIGSLTESFNTMRRDLRTLVQKLLDASVDVAKSSKDLTKYVELTAQAAEQISGLAGKVSHDMVQQLEDVETMAANVDTAFADMDDLSTKATGLEESVSASAEAVAMLQQDTQTVIASMAEGGAGNPEADQGADVVEQCFSGLLEELSDIKQQAKELHGLSQAVADKTGYIIDTVGSIDQLSRKTVQSAETIEASTEEEESSILEIVAAAQSLEDLATDMHEAVARFRL
ncbi:MAG: methyl-accepting chemotaxis protein [Selenomonadaceae bacterium]|nr:methyl-accepting chemotaxis protein [Selenomonadaceae bacterium]MBQ1914587.1 methyl-accepting chemotaxis protein [Selenomonadaceae bacterium]